MYKRDVKRIKEYVHLKGPDGLVDVGSFVLSTIQTPLSRTKSCVSDIKRHGSSSKALWGHKRAGYEYLSQHKKPLYETLVEGSPSLSEALAVATEVPCLGLVKGAFLLQCIGYPTGCLDRHNLKMYNIPLSVCKGKVDTYLEAVDRVGTSESLWNLWCEYVAGGRMNKKLDTADKVSAFHFEAISGEDNVEDSKQ